MTPTALALDLGFDAPVRCLGRSGAPAEPGRAPHGHGSGARRQATSRHSRLHARRVVVRRMGGPVLAPHGHVPGLQREDGSPLRLRRAAGGRALPALRLDAGLRRRAAAGAGDGTSQLFTLEPRGPFSLHSAISFLEGFAPAMHGRGRQVGHLHLAFVPDGERRAAGACVRSRDGALVVEVSGAAEPGAAARQVERILSLDVDGSGFPAVGERDPAIGRLQARYPGLRPVSFPSPFEAGAWFVISQRIRAAQGVALKARISEELGERVAICGEERVAFPAPGVVAELEGLAGLPERKLATLRALAQAAVQGALDGERLRALGGEAAVEELQRLPGVGPVHGAGHRRARRRRARLPRHRRAAHGPRRGAGLRPRRAALAPRSWPAAARRGARTARGWACCCARLEDASHVARCSALAARGLARRARPRARPGATLGRAGQAAAAGETTRRGKSGHHRARWSGDRPGETRGKVPQKHTADGGAPAEPRTGKVEMVR